MFNHKTLLYQYEQLEYKLTTIRRCNLPKTYYVDKFEINDEFVRVYFKLKNTDEVHNLTFTWEEIETPTQLTDKFKIIFI